MPSLKAMKDIKDYLHLYLGCEFYFKGNCYDDGTPVIRVLSACDLDGYHNGAEIQLLLRPLSDMTEEEQAELHKTYHWIQIQSTPAYSYLQTLTWTGESFRYLLSKGFDLFGLIEAGATSINEHKDINPQKMKSLEIRIDTAYDMIRQAQEILDIAIPKENCTTNELKEAKSSLEQARRWTAAYMKMKADKEAMARYEKDLENHNSFYELRKPKREKFPDGPDGDREWHTAFNKWAMDESMSAPNKPGYYRANND